MDEPIRAYIVKDEAGIRSICPSFEGSTLGEIMLEKFIQKHTEVLETLVIEAGENEIDFRRRAIEREDYWEKKDKKIRGYILVHKSPDIISVLAVCPSLQTKPCKEFLSNCIELGFIEMKDEEDELDFLLRLEQARKSFNELIKCGVNICARTPKDTFVAEIKILQKDLTLSLKKFQNK